MREVTASGFRCSLPDHPYTNTISARYYKDGSEILIDQSDIGKRPASLHRANALGCRAFQKSLLSMQFLMHRHIGNSVIR